jgi:phosphatidylserine decarboxylase
MKIRSEVIPFLVIASLFSGIPVIIFLLMSMPVSLSAGSGITCLMITSGYLLYFFRDPHRACTADDTMVIAPADGVIASITRLTSEDFRRIASFCGLEGADLDHFTRKEKIIRISTYLSLLNVHVNRAPISGTSRFLGYFRGRHLFTFEEKSSDVNQHNSILMINRTTRCLINQIVGPVCRRVVYWPDHTRDVDLAVGERFGMMKFGSRLDLYFPADDISVTIQQGDIVRAGMSILATTIN